MVLKKVLLMNSEVPVNAVIRPWGWYVTTLQMPGYKTKVFSVNPGARLSLQLHNHRKEMWSIVKGEGLCTVGSNLMQVSENSLISVPKGVKHRIENLAQIDLVVSEVQIGDYVEEDDIVRLDDDYGRVV